jgi:hypothetical protein
MYDLIDTAELVNKEKQWQNFLKAEATYITVRM